MCLAIPGRIIKIEKDLALVDYGKEKITARIIRGNYKLGDYVLVQSRIVVEKIPKNKFIKEI
mgnify:CR=1 FL=1